MLEFKSKRICFRRFLGTCHITFAGAFIIFAPKLMFTEILVNVGFFILEKGVLSYEN